MKKNIIWIATIDSHEAKIFQTSEAKETPKLIKEIIFETEANPKKGRSFDSFGAGRHAIEPHTTFKEVERQHFASELEKFLHESSNQNKFHSLILVSPHKMFAALEEKLSHEVREKITHKIHKNIHEFSPTEIKKYLTELGVIWIIEPKNLVMATYKP